MGFFSQDCNGCGHPLLSTYVTNRVNRWMNDAVVIQKGGRIISGAYDGYGRIDADYDDDDDARVVGTGWDDAGKPDGSGPTVWHRACWIAAGSPTEYVGESPGSADQGYFFDDADHAVKEPKTAVDVTLARKKADKLAAELKAEEARWAAVYDEKRKADEAQDA